MSEEAKKLTADAASKYNVTPGFGIGAFKFKGINYELDKLSAAELDALVKNGFDGVVAKAAAPKAEK